MNLTTRIRTLLGTPDPAADRVRITDAMARERETCRVKLNSALTELYLLRQRRGIIDRRMCELMNLIAILDRSTED